MADLLVPRGKKLNNRKSGARADAKANRRAEAEKRQLEYDKLTVDQKLALPSLGAKERAKLLVKKQNQKRG
jgi:hypothetical protein